MNFSSVATARLGHCMFVAPFKPNLLHNSIIRFNLDTSRGRNEEENISLDKLSFAYHYRMPHNRSRTAI